MGAKKRLTGLQVAQAFGVSMMTIYTWRKASAKRTGLPHESEENGAARARVFYPIKEIRDWAKLNGIPFALRPEEILKTGIQPGKPGPKPRH